MVPMARYEQRVDELVAARVDEPDNARRAWHEPCGSRASLHLLVLRRPHATRHSAGHAQRSADAVRLAGAIFL